MYGYSSCLSCNWKDGVHDTRGLSYQHPWVVIHHESGSAIGCWSRAVARNVYNALKDGVLPEHLHGCPHLSPF